MRPWSLRQLTASVACAAGHLGGVEVGVDVGAPEGVDGLLGVADEDERGGAAAEAELEDVPLDRVGVLELVDQGHLVAAPQRPDPGAVHRVLQGVAQTDEEVVVGEDAGQALAPLDLLPHLDRQATVRAGPRIPGAQAALGSIGATGFSTAASATRRASARLRVGGLSAPWNLRT